jgi:hypothetical protein
MEQPMADTPGNDPRKLLAATRPAPAPAKPTTAKSTPKSTPKPAPAAKTAPAAPANPAPSPATDTAPRVPSRIGRFAPWAATLVIGVGGATMAVFLFWQEAATTTHIASNPARISEDWVLSDWPDFLEVTAEHSLRLSPADEAAAYLAAKKAVELDPSRAFAWAILAYVEARQAGELSQPAIDALARSMEACPLCDQDLIRWRFNFLLNYWKDAPEELRRKAFEQADILRWVGQNAEFLAEMRYKAGLAGIPFDAYRSAVDTPARSFDIAPAARLRSHADTRG